MGKKITLDFSKVEERSGWNSKEMPEGLHEFKIELVDLKDANDGTAMWTYGLRPTNPKYKTRLFPYYCKHQANQLFKLRDLFTAAGLTVPKKRVGLDPDAPVGKIIAAEVSDATGQYAGRSEIDGVYDRSIIDDDDRVADDEDEIEDDEVEEDEDYDGEEDDADEDADEDEGDEEDDELREEIESLTLAALRKRAKGLGIDTAGVKQAELVELVLEEELAGDDEDDEEDDEEDLGDEDLDDEEFDDEDDEEEEEPEPAPRRRAAAAKKPAAKPAAKAAAPARRTVRRR